MPNSYVQYTANGSTQSFAVTFPYISQSHVTVAVAGVDDATFTWSNATTVLASTMPANLAVVEVRRTTPSASAIIDFNDASTLTEADLDTNSLQFLYLNQESADTAADAINLTSDGKYDATSKIIKNVLNPTGAQDASTKSYVDTQDAAMTANTAADLVLTNADVVLTNADVVLTGLDVGFTNADVVLTNADVVTTAANVIATAAATNADVVLTNADVVLTNADVVLTGNDVTSTNADVVSTNADVVTTAASVVAATAAALGDKVFTAKTATFEIVDSGDAAQGRYAVTASAPVDISLAAAYTAADGDWFTIKDVADTFGTYLVRLVLDNTEFYDPAGGTFSHVVLDFKTTLSLTQTSYIFTYDDGKWRIL